MIKDSGRAITHIPLTVTIGFTSEQPLEVNVVYLLAGVLGSLGVLLVVVCLSFLVLEGILFGIALLILAALVLGVYWLVGYLVHLVILLIPIAIAGILILSFYSFMANCWRQMRQEKFTTPYILLTLVSGTISAAAITGDALSLLVWHRYLLIFLCLTFIALPLWLCLLTYPANRYKADVARQQRAQTLVLKG